MTEKQAEELVRKNLEDYLHRMGHFPDNAGRYHCIAPDHKDGNPSMTIEKNGQYAKCWSHPQPRDTFSIFDAINMLEGIRSLHAQKRHAFAIYQIVIDEVATEKGSSDQAAPIEKVEADKTASDQAAPSKTNKHPKNGVGQADHAHQDHSANRAATPAKNHHARTDVFRPAVEETPETAGSVAAAAAPDPGVATSADTQILETVPENVEVRSSEDFIEIVEFSTIGQEESPAEIPSPQAGPVKSPDSGASIERIPEAELKIMTDADGAEPVPVEVIEPVPVEVIEPPFVEVIESPVEVIESPVEVIESPVEVIESPVEVIESPVEETAEVEVKDDVVELALEVVVTEAEPMTAEAEPEPEPVAEETEPEPVPEAAEPEPETKAAKPEVIAASPDLADRIEPMCMADFLDEALAADQANTIGLTLQPAIPSGFTELDKHLDGGFYPGLYLFCSRPGEGKTTFALQIADAIAAQGLDVLLISMDLTRVELAAKSISRLTLLMDHTIARNQAKTLRQVLDVSSRKTGTEFAQSYLSQVMQAYRQTAGHLHVLEVQARLSSNDVHKLIDRHIAQTTNRPVVILDSLQHLQPMESGQSDTVQADSAVRALMQISRSAGTPIIALSSVIRDNYGCDVVLSLQLEPAAGTLAAPHHLDVKLLKNRHGAIDGKVGYNYYAAYNFFEEK